MSVMSVSTVDNLSTIHWAYLRDSVGQKTDFVRASRDSSRDGETKKGYPT